MNIQAALAAGYTMEEIQAEVAAMQQEQAAKQQQLAPAMAMQPAMQQQFIQDQQAQTPFEILTSSAIEQGRKAIPYARPVVEGVGAGLGGILGGVAGAPSVVGAPGGAVLGAGLGYAGGKKLMDMLEGSQSQGLAGDTLSTLRDVSTGAMMEMGGQSAIPAAGLLWQGAKKLGASAQGIPRVLGDLAEVAGLPRPPLTGIRGGAPGAPGGILPGSGDRILAGYMDPVEASAAKIPMSAGDIRMLSATTPQEMQLAQRMKMAEALRATDKNSAIGGKLTDIEAGKLTWGTDFIKQQLGIEGNAALTPATIGKVFRRLGGEFDDFASKVGSIKIDKQAAADLQGILAETEGGHASQIASYVKRLEDAAAQYGGEIPPRVWSSLRHDLGKTIQAAGGQGNFAKLHDASAVQGVLDDMLHASASPELQQSIAQTRRQYGILKTALSRDSGVNAAGEVNPATFFNAYMKKSPSRYMNFENDPVARAFGTLNLLSKKALPSSGTAERLLANPGRTGINATKAILGLELTRRGIQGISDTSK